MTEHNELSDRELDILRLVATGASNKEIAQKLYISSNTVKVHLRNIFAKINVASRTEAAMYAVQYGYVDAPPQIGDDIGAIVDTGDKNAVGVQKYRIRPVALWSVVLVVVVLVIAIIYLVSFNLAGQGEPIVASPEADFPRWEERSKMPTAKSGFVTVTYDSQVYLIGGENGIEIVDTVERYNPETDTWNILSNKPIGVSDVSGALIGGKIYIPGGRLSSGETTNVLEIYDPIEDKWEQGRSLPLTISGYASATFEGKLYIFGGWDGDRFRDEVYEYDPETDQWYEHSSMPTPRAYAGAAVSSGKIYVIGGENQNGPLNWNEVYIPEFENSENAPWEDAEPLPDERSGVGVVDVVDNIFVIGGQNLDGNSTPSYIYLPKEDIWQSFDLPISREWSRMGLSLVGKELFILGGDLSDVPTDGNYTYQVIFTVSFPVIVK